MVILKTGISSSGKEMHYSVGAIIKRGDEYLLIDRANPPYGFAGLAGHIDEGESSEEALFREVTEESGLRVVEFRLLYEEELDWNKCSRGVGTHYWHLYECEVMGEVKRDFGETKSIGWYTREEIARLTLEPAWKYWFEKEGIV